MSHSNVAFFFLKLSLKITLSLFSHLAQCLGYRYSVNVYLSQMNHFLVYHISKFLVSYLLFPK